MAQTPHLAAAIGPRVRTSPYLRQTIEAGLVAVSAYNHMWLPMSYGNPDAEYERLTQGASMWDVAAQRHLEITGPDADALVGVLTVIDTGDVGEGTGAYAPMVDFDGILVNDPILLHTAPGEWRLSIADSDVRLWIDALARLHDFTARVAELDTATLAIQGPLADDVITALGAGWATDLDDLRFAPGVVDDIEITISSSGWSNQGGYELFLDDPSHAAGLWNAVLEAGADSNIGPGAPNPAERIENALLSYGTDTGYEANPYELGLGDLVDIEAGSFVGDAALMAVREQGATRQLLGVRLDGAEMEALDQPCAVHDDSNHIGELRAAAWSPRFSANLGLVLVDATAEAGERIEIVGHAHLGGGELLDLPFDER